MAHDEHGRGPALLTEPKVVLLAFPLAMISKRVERSESIDVLELFDRIVVDTEQAKQSMLDSEP